VKRFLFIVSVFLLPCGLSAASDWNEYSGVAHELAGERLELRDEPLAAQFEYMEALKAALAYAELGANENGLAWARAEYLLEKIHRLNRENCLHQDFRQFLQDVESILKERGKQVPPAFSARKTYYSASAYLQSGEAEKARAEPHKLSLITKWQILGAFDNDQGFDTDYIGEDRTPDFSASYAGRKKAVRWRIFESRDPLGVVNPGELFRPNEQASGYFATYIYSPDDRQAMLRLGSDGYWKIWLNRQAVFSGNEDRTLALDQNEKRVCLRQGWNLLLLKTGVVTGDWRFLLRLTSASGAPFTDLKYDMSPHEINSSSPIDPTAFPGGEGATNILTAYLQNEKNDSRAYLYLGRLLSWRNIFGDSATHARMLLDNGARLSGDDPAALYSLSETLRSESVLDRDENLRLSVLRRLRENGQAPVISNLLLAEHYLGGKYNLAEAENCAREALRENPQSQRALLLLEKIHSRRGLSAQASLETKHALAANPLSLSALKEDCRQALIAGDFVRILNACSLAVRLDATDEELLTYRLTALNETGQQEKALETIRAFLELKPYSERAHRLLREKLFAARAYPAALAATEDRLAFCPDDADAWEAKGNCLHLLGKNTEAVSAWNEALALGGGSQKLSDYQEFLGLKSNTENSDTSVISELIRQSAAFCQNRNSPVVFLLCEDAETLKPDNLRSRRCTRLVKILNREGADTFSRYEISFRRDLEQLDVISARVIPEDGRPVRHGFSSGNAVYFPGLVPGDVVELSYRLNRHKRDEFGSYFGYIYRFQKDAPVFISRYLLDTPEGFAIHAHVGNGAPQARESHANGRKTFSWEMRELPAITDEPFMPHPDEFVPAVQVSTFADWRSFGQWYEHLIDGQAESAPEIRTLANSLTDGINSDEAKLAALFKWVSLNIRNTGWEYGIYGFKPYSAPNVLTRGFGDCKDKTNLLNALARVAGFDAKPALLRTSSGASPAGAIIMQDLALPIMNHFNHCISVVLLQGKTYFLDATRLYRGLDEIPASIAGTPALLVDGGNSRLITVPGESVTSHTLLENTRLTLSADGKAEIEQDISGTGITSVFLRAYFRKYANQEHLVMLHFARNLWGEAATATAEFKDGETCSLACRAPVPAYAAATDNSLRFSLPKNFLFGEIGAKAAFPEKMMDFTLCSRRFHDLLLPYPFSQRRNYVITIPQGFSLIGQLPQIYEEDSFGKIEVKTEAAHREIRISCELLLKTSRIPVADYAKFRRFCRLADALLETAIVLEKK
jgi:tetratricopeptide (TPR) repeat protein